MQPPGEGWQRHTAARVGAGVLACALLALALIASRRPPKVVPDATAPAWSLSDFAGDGTPDSLGLEDPADRRAFSNWFTFLAEAQYFIPPAERPVEISDCAALVRFSYREALSRHDGAWAGRLKLPALPPMPQVRKYQYPFTPLGARLFRVAPGPFAGADAGGAAFAEFADAETLLRRNCHWVSRDVRRASPGDLLFFRQLEQDQPFHVMVFLGPGQFESGAGEWVVYHTGPLAGGPGEIRRPSLKELLRHPAPRWRPLEGNSNFLGVYRWNILRDMV